ncbi:L-ascorbate oxidase homolog [Arachis ipaensis]|uniref:L-ascorbate oxidase homolog n=1 Tax=Arachis ipaensis TaxID=130454 RepID=UPI000A2B83C8|nr:L-ascorbate oxidase homolog [Arachis ipaensis]
MVDNVKLKHQSIFKLKILGDLKFFLGLKLARSKDGISLTQRKYAISSLEETCYLGCKPATTPMDVTLKLRAGEGDPVSNPFHYRRLIGRLMYLTIFRPDITFAVVKLAQFMSDPHLPYIIKEGKNHQKREIYIYRNGSCSYFRGDALPLCSETPLKLAQYYGVGDKVFQYNLISDSPAEYINKITVAPNVLNATFRDFVEIVFENPTVSVQSYNLDGYSFFLVGMEEGRWSPDKRENYNLLDAVSRHTVQVFPNSWSAILLTFDNAGMWNLRSENAENRYLGQQMYVSVLSPEKSLRDEYNLPLTQQVCGIVKDMPVPAPVYH